MIYTKPMQNNLLRVDFINCSVISNISKHYLKYIPEITKETKILFSRHELTYRSFLPLQLNKNENEIIDYLQKINKPQLHLEFMVNNNSSGYLDLILSDYSFNLWLNNLPEKIIELEISALNEEPNFILHYTHARCQSLLRLGIEEKIIKKELDLTQRDWLQLNSNWEKKLLWQLLEITDNFIDHNSLLRFAEVILEYERNCQIWGDIKKNQPSLSVNRLAIIALASFILNFLVKKVFQIELSNFL